MGYLKHAVKGVSWMASLRFLTRIVAFIRIAILARLLGPVEFGIFGIASLVLSFLEIVTGTGVNTLLIQGEVDFDKYINTAWVVSIARGVLVFLIIYISAPFVSLFFNSPLSESVLRIVSLVAILRGLINPSIVRFQKDLEFKKEFWLRGSVFIVDSTVAVSLAFMTGAAVSLVWGLIAGVFAEIAISFMFVKPRPAFVFKFKQIRRVIKRGKWLTFTGVLNYMSNEGDDAVVGKVLNTASLGVYQIAHKISLLPLSEITVVVHKVTFPIYVRIAGDIKRLRKAYFRTLSTTSLLVIPVGLILILFPEKVILILLGQKWLGAVGVLRILAVSGIVRAIMGTAGAVYLSLRRQEYTTVISVVRFLVILVSVVPLTLKYGIMGAGISSLLAVLSTVPVNIYFLSRMLGEQDFGK